HCREKNPLDSIILHEIPGRRRTAIPTVDQCRKTRRRHRELLFPNPVHHRVNTLPPGEAQSCAMWFARAVCPVGLTSSWQDRFPVACTASVLVSHSARDSHPNGAPRIYPGAATLSTGLEQRQKNLYIMGELAV